MQMSRGCGCMLLVLAAVNLVFVISAILGLILGNVDPAWLGLIAVIVFGANMVSALMMGVAGYRGQPIGAAQGRDDELGTAVPAEEEGDSAGYDDRE